jgi:hypothetical protein
MVIDIIAYQIPLKILQGSILRSAFAHRLQGLHGVAGDLFRVARDLIPSTLDESTMDEVD